jgi:peptidyl-prolyl cis-trans isomerase C
MNRSMRAASWLGVFALIACCGGAGRSAESHKPGAPRPNAEVLAVVSTVDHRAITLPDVEELVRAGMPSGEALGRLQAELLLMDEAERRGFERDATVRAVASQALVQALLESEVASVRVPESDVAASYQQQASRFRPAERRGSVHVLARLPKNPSPDFETRAQALVRQLGAELAATRDRDAFIAGHAGRVMSGIDLVAERIPAVDRGAKLAPAYIDALFSLQRPGDVSKPVRSKYGWHAILLLAIERLPATSYEDARASIEAELLLKARTEHVAALIEGLRARHRVEISADVDATLAAIGSQD